MINITARSFKLLLPWLFLPLLLALFDCALAQNESTAASSLAQNSEEVGSEEESKKPADNPLNLKIEQFIEADKVTSTWFAAVEKLLEDYGLDGSLAGQAIGTVALSLVLFILYFLVKWLFKYIFTKTKIVHLTKSIPNKRASTYGRIIKWIFSLSLLLAYLSSLVVIWSSSESSILESTTVSQFIQACISVFVLLGIGVLIFELINSGLELLFEKFGKDSARLDTLMPIIKNTVFSAFFLLMGLTILSEVGINVFPLLAGAGVVGFAIGFGAQTLVKDLLTGFIIIVEDLFKVGDVARVGGKIGLVERITIRKVQLRDLNGIVYTVPFSEISIVENLTKDYSFYVMDIGIAYREDPDEVIKILHQIDEELRADKEFADKILQPIEIFGLDQFGNSAIVIKARIKTKPIMQWTVGREFNRRMKYAFDKHNIEIPFPHQTIYFGEDKDGKAPPAYIKTLDDNTKPAGELESN